MQVKCVRRNLAVAAINVNGASMPFREEPGTISEHVISEMHKSEWGRVFWINTTLFPEITKTWRLSFKYSTCKKSMTWYRFYCRALPIIWIEHSLQKKWQPAAEMMGVIKHTSLQTEGQLWTIHLTYCNHKLDWAAQMTWSPTRSNCQPAPSSRSKNLAASTQRSSASQYLLSKKQNRSIWASSPCLATFSRLLMQRIQNVVAKETQ